MTNRRSTQGPVLPRLFRPEEIADALGCSEWWVKEQARRRRIPFTRVGGAYRFTADHLTEIVDLYEERPAQAAQLPDGTSSTPLVRPAHRSRPDAVPRLRSRPPRRAQRLSTAA